MPINDNKNTPRLSLYLRVSQECDFTALLVIPVGEPFTVTFQTVHSDWPCYLRDYEACAPSALP